MTIYYRVSTAKGIEIEKRPHGHYTGNPELGRNVFKSLPAAKRRFNTVIAEEISRLTELRRHLRSIQSRAQLIEDQDESGDAQL